MKIHPVEAEMDEQMDTHDKACSHILQLCEHIYKYNGSKNKQS